MLKKIMVAVLSLGLLLSFTQVDTHTADAKTVKSYKNCKALNKVYKGGVAKSKNTKNKVQALCIKSTLSKKYAA